MRIPVTLAERGVFLGPDDADELIDLLTDAATVTGVLAGHPAAEAALAADGTGPARDCAELTIDLRLAAARLDDDTAASPEASHISGHGRKGEQPARKAPRRAAENQHSG